MHGETVKLNCKKKKNVNYTCDFLCAVLYIPLCCAEDFPTIRNTGRMGDDIFLSVSFQEIYVVRVVPCPRISAVSQFLCFEHLLPFFES